MNEDRDFVAFFASFAGEVRRLIGELELSGYQFANRSQALVAPHPETESLLQVFSNNGVRLPTALEAFYRRFGAIDLSGRHADWPAPAYADPLRVDPLDVAVEEFQTRFLASPEEREWYREVYGGFYFVIAPDYRHKENVSGGKPYGIVLPSIADDPQVNGLPWNLRFTEYLHFALSKGGFPGLEGSP